MLDPELIDLVNYNQIMADLKAMTYASAGFWRTRAAAFANDPFQAQVCLELADSIECGFSFGEDFV